VLVVIGSLRHTFHERITPHMKFAALYLDLNSPSPDDSLGASRPVHAGVKERSLLKSHFTAVSSSSVKTVTDSLDRLNCCLQ